MGCCVIAEGWKDGDLLGRALVAVDATAGENGTGLGLAERSIVGVVGAAARVATGIVLVTEAAGGRRVGLADPLLRVVVPVIGPE